MKTSSRRVEPLIQLPAGTVNLVIKHAIYACRNFYYINFYLSTVRFSNFLFRRFDSLSTPTHKPFGKSLNRPKNHNFKSLISSESSGNCRVKMALNDILKHMPSMGFDFSDFSPEADMDFMGSPQNFRVLEAPPFKNVSFAITSLS